MLCGVAADGTWRADLHDPLLDDAVGVLTPFAAFLLTVHASGVLAVVSGLAMTQMAPLH